MAEPDFDKILRDSIPGWTQAEFVFLESRPWWAPSVQTELARTDTIGIQTGTGQTDSEAAALTDYRCHSVPTTRSIHEQILTGNIAGVILIAEQQLRECLLLLARLSRLCRSHPPVLVIVPEKSASMMPLLLESGATTVMSQAVTDIQVADCHITAAH